MPCIKLSYQSVRFALSGGLSTVSHWSVMALMMGIGVSPSMATAIGALVGAIINYILQRNVTFQSTISHQFALGRYLGVCTLAWTVNLILFELLHYTLLLSVLISQCIATFVIALMSYFLYKRVVFNGR